MAKEWTNKSCGQTVFDNVSTFSSCLSTWCSALSCALSSACTQQGAGSELSTCLAHALGAASAAAGLWFFYLHVDAPTFSGTWSARVLVRNRCHLAVILEQRAHRVSWTTAMMRVTKFLLLTANVSAWAPDFCRALECNDTGSGIGVHSMILGPIRAIAGSTSPKPNVGELRSASEIATALNRCARGNFSDFANTNTSYLRQALVGFNTLDYTNAAMLAASCMTLRLENMAR